MDELGGLDAVVVCVGVAGFGPAESVGDAVAEHLLTVNALAPAAVLRAALTAVPPGGALAAVTGVVVDAAPGGHGGLRGAEGRAGRLAGRGAPRAAAHRPGRSGHQAAARGVGVRGAGRGRRPRPPCPGGVPVGEAVDVILAALTEPAAPGGPHGGGPRRSP